MGLADCQSADPEFAVFSSMQYGLRAALKLIRNYIDGSAASGVRFNTIDKVIRRWAPPSENNTEGYIRFVCQRTGIHRYQNLASNDKKMLCRIVQAMGQMECGASLPMELIESAYDLI